MKLSRAFLLHLEHVLVIPNDENEIQDLSITPCSLLSFCNFLHRILQTHAFANIFPTWNIVDIKRKMDEHSRPQQRQMSRL